MFLHKYYDKVLGVVLLFQIGFTGSGCNSLSDSSDVDRCIHAGRHTYQHHMILKDDPTTFPARKTT